MAKMFRNKTSLILLMASLVFSTGCGRSEDPSRISYIQVKGAKICDPENLYAAVNDHVDKLYRNYDQGEVYDVLKTILISVYNGASKINDCELTAVINSYHRPSDFFGGVILQTYTIDYYVKGDKICVDRKIPEGVDLSKTDFEEKHPILAESMREYKWKKKILYLGKPWANWPPDKPAGYHFINFAPICLSIEKTKNSLSVNGFGNNHITIHETDYDKLGFFYDK